VARANPTCQRHLRGALQRKTCRLLEPARLATTATNLPLFRFAKGKTGVLCSHFTPFVRTESYASKPQRLRAFWVVLLLAGSLSFLCLYSQTTGSKRNLQNATLPAASGEQPGPYHALIIGNQNYRYLKPPSRPRSTMPMRLRNCCTIASIPQQCKLGQRRRCHP